jgi:glycosyltransferase involved in cell wall biosynthesis
VENRGNHTAAGLTGSHDAALTARGGVRLLPTGLDSGAPTSTAAVRGLRVALVHDWLTGMRGGEKVLEVFCELYPDADIFTLLHVPGSVSQTIERHPIRTSFVQHLPSARRHYRRYLPLFPLAIETFALDKYDLVISSSHCVAKSAVAASHARHLCYCFTPMRYAWEQFDAYFGPRRVGRVKAALFRPVLAALARWDRATAGRPDAYLADSQHVASRIRRYYNRAATVVYPPVNSTFYHPDGTMPRGYALVVSALVPYKRVDRAIEACRLARMPLKIVGSGPEAGRLQRMAGDHVELLGTKTDDEIRALYRGAEVVVMPGEEDFGIVPVEAQACGRPVVALARGGALETVIDGVTGVLVQDESAAALADGLRAAGRRSFDPGAIRLHALTFSRDRFVAEFQAQVDGLIHGRQMEPGSERDERAHAPIAGA